MSILPCEHCGGEGRIFKSKYGGNDPDVWDAGKCEACEGSGNQPCQMHGCGEDAVAFNEDGEALCEDCFVEWQSEAFARS
jgi:RecJ-like exonuclease